MTRLQRLFRIAWVFCRYRLDTFLPIAELPAPLKVFFLLAPWHLFPQPKLDRGDRLRLALEELGPVFVKFGQILSTRRDLLPDDMAESLKNLQDRVPPFPSNEARSIIETSLGAPVSDLFAEFSPDPLASASVAQVHAATLRNGQKVVVKVLRPGIEKVIRQDLALMYLMAGLLEKYWSEGKRLHPVEVVADYDSTIHDELDLQREAANASQLRRNFENSSLIYIPFIDWDYTRKSVLVMER
ncbi:MAG TPA: ubiquinone biosynthesis regulatory protein kinase UbiB, partial [Marinobacter adhaerens]|nr:ubiquinone biosynthesis regulatory protein kinase UbiB [Marinobacter adhaerens]